MNRTTSIAFGEARSILASLNRREAEDPTRNPTALYLRTPGEFSDLEESSHALARLEALIQQTASVHAYEAEQLTRYITRALDALPPLAWSLDQPIELVGLTEYVSRNYLIAPTPANKRVCSRTACNRLIIPLLKLHGPMHFDAPPPRLLYNHPWLPGHTLIIAGPSPLLFALFSGYLDKFFTVTGLLEEPRSFLAAYPFRWKVPKNKDQRARNTWHVARTNNMCRELLTGYDAALLRVTTPTTRGAIEMLLFLHHAQQNTGMWEVIQRELENELARLDHFHGPLELRILHDRMRHIEPFLATTRLPPNTCVDILKYNEP